MKQIINFINQYKFTKNYEYQIKSNLINLIKNKFNLDLKEDNIKVKNNIIHLNINSKIKAFFVLNKKNLLQDLNNLLNSKDNKIKDIN